MLVAGVGTFVVLGPLGGFDRIDRWRSGGSLAPLTPVEPPSREAPVAARFEERLPAAETAPADQPEAPPPAVVEPVKPAPAEKAVEPAAPARAKPVRRRRPKAAKPATKAVKPVSSQNMIGVYVALKLTNGREVKGALVEQTPSFYKIELPGLGAMSYPARDVVSITPAQ